MKLRRRGYKHQQKKRNNKRFSCVFSPFWMPSKRRDKTKNCMIAMNYAKGVGRWSRAHRCRAAFPWSKESRTAEWVVRHRIIVRVKWRRRRRSCCRQDYAERDAASQRVVTNWQKHIVIIYVLCTRFASKMLCILGVTRWLQCCN